MGAITRAAANNITTGGVILPAGINDTSVASISELEQVATGGGLNLISSQTASGSASIEFTSGIDSTYDTYYWELINMHSSSDAVPLQFNMSTDGGSNYNVTKTSTIIDTYHYESDAAAALRYNGGLAQSTGYAPLCNSGGNDNDQVTSAILYLFNPSSTTYVKHFISSGSTVSYDDANFVQHNAGYGNTTSAINAIIFRFSSGNIDAGTIKMYGIQSS